MKRVRVVHKKLGRVKFAKAPVNGYADFDLNTAFIDERINGYDHLYTLIHEILHLQNPKWGEARVEGHSRQLAELVWKESYRKVIL